MKKLIKKITIHGDTNLIREANAELFIHIIKNELKNCKADTEKKLNYLQNITNIIQNNQDYQENSYKKNL